MRLISRLLLALGLVLALACASGAPATDPDARIRYYSKRIKEDPRLYPAHALLGEAYLSRARATHDPNDMALARAAFERSMAIQPNYEALAGLAALSGFGHRFEDALSWGRQAADANREDPRIQALLVEALLGLGRDGEARALLPADGAAQANLDFYTAAALGAWMKANGRLEEAAKAFEAAARFASQPQQKAAELAVWARVSEAGVWLDAGDLERARPLLEAVRRDAPEDRFLREHEAELAAQEGRLAEALAIYEELLKSGSDPEAHRAAASVARRLGRTEDARRHFEAAERFYRRILDDGEIYSLESLARLYLDAGVNLEEAKELARRNLEFKRDRSALELAQTLSVPVPAR
jgi:tetratricopeptide (TPR) repeat protein